MLKADYRIKGKEAQDILYLAKEKMENKELLKNQKTIDIKEADLLKGFFLRAVGSGPESAKVNSILSKVMKYEKEKPKLTRKENERLEKDFKRDILTLNEEELSILLNVCFTKLSSDIKIEEQSYKELPKYTMKTLQIILSLKEKEDGSSINYKEKVESEMEKYSEQSLQLYNLVFGSAQDLKNSIDESSYINDAVVAVYGGMYNVIIDRISGLDDISKKVNLSNGVVFSGSGGRFWFINPEGIRKGIIGSIQKDLGKKELIEQVVEEIKGYAEKNPFFKESMIDNQITVDKSEEKSANKEENGTSKDEKKDHKEPIGEDLKNIVYKRTMYIIKHKMKSKDKNNRSLEEIVKSVVNDLEKNYIIKGMDPEDVLKKISSKEIVLDEDISNLIEKRARLEASNKIEYYEKSHNKVKAAINEIPEIKKAVMEKNSEIWMSIMDKDMKKASNSNRLSTLMESYRVLGEKYKDIYESENWNINPVYFGMLIKNVGDRSYSEFFQSYMKYINEKNMNSRDNKEEGKTDIKDIIQESKEMYGVLKDKPDEFYRGEFFKWIINNSVEKAVLRSVTEADVMQNEWEKYESKSRSNPAIIEDKKATNTAENAINTIDEVKKVIKSGKDIKEVIVISDWKFLLRQYLTTKKKAEEIDNLEIMGYPGQKTEREGSTLKYSSRASFANAMLGELGKIIDYDDVADESIPHERIKLGFDTLKEVRPKVYIGLKKDNDIDKNEVVYTEFGTVIENDRSKSKQNSTLNDDSDERSIDD